MPLYRSYIKPFLHHPLNRQNKIVAVTNFLRWQLLLRHAKLNDSFIIAPYIGGLRCIARKGLHGITGNLYSGLHDFDEMALLLHFLRAEDQFFDIGANVGIYTLLASGLKGARSMSFEPVPDTFSILKNNIGLNNLEDKVRLFNVGVGLIEDVLEFSADKDTENSVVGIEYKGTKTKVPIINLDKIFLKDIDRCTMMKIDTEGFEDQVISGAQEILSNPHVKLIQVEMNKPEKVHTLLTDFGFLSHTYDAVTRKFTRIDYSAANMLYIRDMPFVQDRIQMAGKIEILKGRYI